MISGYLLLGIIGLSGVGFLLWTLALHHDNPDIPFSAKAGRICLGLLLIFGLSLLIVDAKDKEQTILKPLQTEVLENGKQVQYVIGYDGERINLEDLSEADDWYPKDTTY